MWRWTMNILAGFSVVMLLLIGALWGSSYWIAERYAWPRDGGVVLDSLTNIRGRVAFERIRYAAWYVALMRERNAKLPGGGYTVDHDPEPYNWDEDPPPPVRTFRLLGLFVAWGSGRDPSYLQECTHQVYIPYYWLLPLCLPMPALWLRRWWHRRRAYWRVRMGLCRVCGYDLRASPERCPECGIGVGEARSPKPE